MHPDVAVAFDRMTATARRDVITVVINSRHMEAEVIGWFQRAAFERIEAIEEPKGIVSAHQPRAAPGRRRSTREAPHGIPNRSRRARVKQRGSAWRDLIERGL